MAAPLTTKRRIVQIAAAILLTCNFTVFTSNTIFFGMVCLPIIHCNACPLTWFNCPIYMISESIQFHSVPWLALGLIAGTGVLVGRFFCGWICPMGLLQDLAHKIPLPHPRFPMSLRWLKYAFLLLSVGAVSYWAGKEVLYFFCTYCPVATMEVAIPQLFSKFTPPADAWRILRFTVLAAVLLWILFHRRGFCKAMCPVGALIAFFNKFSLFSVRLDPDACIHCKKCDQACPMNIPVEESSRTGRAISRHSECIGCLSCEQACPVHAIHNNSHILQKPPQATDTPH